MTAEDFLEIADFFPQAAFLVGADGRVLAANRSAERAGFGPSLVTGRTLAELSETPADEIDAWLRAARRSREPIPGALVLRTAGGVRVSCSVLGAALRAAGGGPPAEIMVRIAGAEDPSREGYLLLDQKIRELDQEIQSRRGLELALREERERLEVTLSSIGDGVIITDTKGKVEFLNAVAEKLTGWKNDEARGEALELVFPIVNETSREPAENPVRRAIATGQIVGLANHTVLLAKDGVERAIDDSAAPIRGRDGEIFGVVLVFRDVTVQRTFERERARLAAIVSSSEDAIIGFDRNGTVTDWNEGAERLFGFESSEVVGRPFTDTIVPADRADEFFSVIARVAGGERVDHFETVRLHKSRRRIDVSIRVSPVRSSEGEVTGISAIDRDISERKRSERRRNVRLAVTQAIALAGDGESVVRRVIEAIATGLGWRVGAYWSVGEQGRALECDELWYDPATPAEEFERESRRRSLARDEGLAGRAWSQGACFWVRDVSRDVNFPRAPAAERIGLHAGFACPVSAHDDCLGVIEFFSGEILEPDDELLEMMGTIGNQLGQFLERRAAEHLLRESEERLRLALEAGRMGTWEWQIASGHVRWSPGLEAIHGLEEGTFAGTFEAFQRDIHPDDRERLLESVRRTVEGQGEHHIEYRIVLPDGTVRWLEARGRLVLESAGRPARMTGVCMDVTDRIEAAKRVRETELRFRQLAENINNVFWMVDPHAPATLYLSPAYEAIWGVPVARLYSEPRSFLESVHPADRQAVADATARQKEGETTQIEYRIFRPDGSVRWIWDRGFPIRESSGRVDRVCGIAEDITERKYTEATLRFLSDASRSLAALVDYRSTLQKVAALAVPDFADWCSVDMVGKGGELDRLAVAHADPDKQSLAIELAKRYPPDPTVPYGPLQVLRTGEPELMTAIPEELILRAARDDEHLRILRALGLKSYICVPLVGKDRIVGVLTFIAAESGRRFGPEDLATAEDLAHRASIAIENARLYSDLRDADRRKDEFLAMLAHELRNPLAPIRSGLEVLAIDAGDEKTETIELMQGQVDHLVRLVDDLLDVSRIMRGRIELRREPLPLSQILEQAVDALRQTIEAAGQELVVTAPEEEVWLEADPVRLVQVIENLLGNASKYSDTGGRIELGAEQRGSAVILRVRDQGVGIEADLLPRVFDLFTQARRSLDRAQGGLGIGLTLVKNLVALHGGTVSARSDGPGCGSEFIVSLPVAGQRAASRDRPSKRIEVVRGVSRRVLIVDDNVAAARLLHVLLSRIGDHEIRIAHDGPSAIEETRSFGPEIILLDIGLPGIDGYEVARRLREDPGIERPFLVALTGYGQEEDRRRSKEAGFDEHLVKPPDLDAIRRVLHDPKALQASTELTASSEPPEPAGA